MTFISAATPIIINNAADLENINNNLSGNYVLGGNIDLSGVNFTPIGSLVNPFTGTFNGNGYTISNLSINLPSTSHVGLFGWVGQTGNVHSLRLSNVSVIGNGDVGGLAGGVEGVIAECSVSGSVSGG